MCVCVERERERERGEGEFVVKEREREREREVCRYVCQSLWREHIWQKCLCVMIMRCSG